MSKASDIPSGVTCDRDHGLTVDGWLHVDDRSPCPEMNAEYRRLAAEVFAGRLDARGIIDGTTETGGHRANGPAPDHKEM